MGGYTRLDYLKAPHCCSFTNTQSGKFRNFLQLSFSVKLIFVILEVHIMPFFVISETLILTFEKFQSSKDAKFKTSRFVQKGTYLVFGFLDLL